MRTTVAAALAALLAAAAPAAELLVLESDRADLAPGAVIDAAAPISLAAGERVLFVAGDGALVERVGPFDGPAAAEAGGEDGLIATLQAVASRSRTRSALGATRGGAAGEEAAFDLIAGGDWCLSGAPPRLALPLRQQDRLVALEPSKGGAVEFVWPGGAATVPWPQGAPFEPGIAYAVTVDAVRLADFSIRPRPAAGGGAAAQVAALERAGCRAQAEAALAALAR